MALLIGICYLSFLKSLSLRIATLFITGGVVFLSGAILMEIPGGFLYEKYGFSSWHYIASYALEEVLELLGIIVFIYGLLCFIDDETRDPSGDSQSLHICIGVGRSSKASVEA